MTSKRDIERILDEWLADGPTEAPNRVLATVEERIGRQPQQPAWRFHLGGARLSREFRAIAVVAAAVIVIAAGIFVWRSPGQPVVGATQSPPLETPSSSAVNVTGPTPVALPSARSIQTLASISVGVSSGQGTGLIASDGTTIWVSTDTLIIGIDPRTNLITARIHVPKTAFSSPIAATKGAIWLDAPDANPLTLDRYDSATGKLVASVPVPGVLFPVAAEGAIWVDQQPGGAAFRIDPATSKVVATVRVGTGSPIGLGAVAFGAGAIWVVDGDPSSIVEISPTTNKVIRTISTARTFPWVSASMSVGSGAIWGTNGGSLAKIDSVTGATSWTANFDGTLNKALIHSDAIWVGLVARTTSTAGIELALDPTSGVPIDALRIADGQVTDAIEAFGSVWLVLGQQGLVERFSQDVLTVTRSPIPSVGPAASQP